VLLEVVHKAHEDSQAEDEDRFLRATTVINESRTQMLLNNPNIGIKIADGTFYPILDKGIGGRKKLILTTVKDDQTSVQIDLYESDTKDLPSGRYVGSLLIEEVASSLAGEAEIDVIAGVFGYRKEILAKINFMLNRLDATGQFFKNRKKVIESLRKRKEAVLQHCPE